MVANLAHSTDVLSGRKDVRVAVKPGGVACLNGPQQEEQQLNGVGFYSNCVACLWECLRKTLLKS